MDERKDLFSSCFSLENLIIAANKCYSGVKWKRQPQKFMNNISTNCLKLQRELFSGSYKSSKTKRFFVNERGKIRNILPVAYRDRVAQRCFCDVVLEPIAEQYAIYDCSACIKGRGLSFASDRVKAFAEAADMDSYVVHFDFSDYFHSIKLDKMLQLLDKLVDGDAKSLWFVEESLKSDLYGLELGSHVAQLSAAIYPTEMDRAIQSTEGVTGYHRYMDDGIIFCQTLETAQYLKTFVQEQSEKLGLIINPKKTFYNKITHPFLFCKIRYTKLADGSVRRNVRKPQTRYSMKHIKNVIRKSKTEPSIDLVPVHASFYGYLKRGDANLERLLDKAFEDCDLSF